MLLDRLPPWATTGVGSLPFDSAEAAVAHVMTSYDVPFCPQLPRLEGDMISAWRSPPRAWDAFVAALRRAPPAHRVVKLQVTGPITLACAVDGADAFELADDVAALVAGQVRDLAALGLDAVLIVDEPSLRERDGVERAWEPLRAVAPCWGLHLCGPVPWPTVARAEPDVLSFDLALGPPDAAVLDGLLARSSRIAWGIVQPHRPEYAPQARERLLEALALVGATGEQSLLTPSCGSGIVPLAREADLVAALSEVRVALSR
jgi:methionine synthase II (cobalamin-independent)